MEFGLREALLLIGSVVIVGILLDGFRRKYAGKKAAKRQGASDEKVDADFDLFAGEVASAPRPARKRAELVSSADLAESDLTADSLSDEALEAGPVLDTHSAEGIVSKPRKVSYREAAQVRVGKAETETVTAGDEDELSDFTFGAAEVVSVRRPGREEVEQDAPEPEPQGKDTRVANFEEVIVINVMAKPQDDISGNDLLRALLSVGLRFGEMNIFHRYEQLTGKGAILFSAVNVVEPGTFDLNHMEDFKTPGICMFLRLPGPKRSLHAFEQLVESARKIGNMLGADLKDEAHSVLTTQTIEHYRQRVLEFERKMLSQRAGPR